MIFIVAAIAVCVAIYWFVILGKSESSKFKKIPSEAGLPLLGVVTNLEKPICNYFVKLGHKHGPIFQVKFGLRNVVVLNSMEYLKAAFVDNADALNGRWDAQKFFFGCYTNGLIFIEGNVWATQRSFVLRTLREFGVGRARAMEIISEEIEYLLEDLEKHDSKRIDLMTFFPLYTTNVILKFIMNKRYTREHPDLKKIQKYMAILATSDDSVANFLLMFPFLEKSKLAMLFIMWLTSRKQLADECHAVFRKEIKDHISKLDLNSEGDDLIDRFLIKQHQLKMENADLDSFSEFQLVRNGFEMVFAGFDTTAITLVWFCMFMAIYPDIQKKVYEEVIDKIGNQRMPIMSDKVSLVYTQAVMDEMSRCSTLGPLAVWHRAVTNVNLKGYFIPKDTIVVPNILAHHVDAAVWEKPLEFYPEHFLTTGDNGEMKYKPREDLIHFGIGKRICLGESLARMEVFLMTMTVVQRYHVELAEKKSHFDIFAGRDGIIRAPSVGDFILRKRK